MTKRKTIKITLDNEVVFRLELQGSEEIVNRVIESYDFRNALEDATEKLINMKVQESTMQTIKPKVIGEKK